MMTESSQQNPYLLVKQANEDFKNQNFGMALSKLYQAQKISPRLPELRHNLKVINNQIKLQQPSMFFHSYMNLSEALLFCLLFNIIFLLSRKIINNKFLKNIILVLFIFSLLNLSLIALEQKCKSFGVVYKITTHVYSGDNEDFTELFELTDGQVIEIKKQETSWSQIKHGEELGWIRNEDIIKID
jgi:hypothetical protein